MANILKRFKDIMSANINALLDKAEDPEKIIDQYIRDIESDLGKVKAETAAVMASETRAKRELDECLAEMEKMQKYAQKALLAGNEKDARAFLEKKVRLGEQQTILQKNYELAAANAEKMKNMHDKLVRDMQDLESRRAAVKSKIAVAKTQEKMNKLGSGISGAGEAMSAFDKMEEKANRMLDEAEALSQLNAPAEDPVEDLMEKYDEKESPQVEDELAALKEKLGL